MIIGGLETAQQTSPDATRVAATGLGPRLRLNDKLANLDRPVTLIVIGRKHLEVHVARTLTCLVRTLEELGDTNYMFPAEIELTL